MVSSVCKALSLSCEAYKEGVLIWSGERWDKWPFGVSLLWPVLLEFKSYLHMVCVELKELIKM